MLKIIYEGTGNAADSTSKVRCELELDMAATWDQHLADFLYFLNNAGYIIDACAINDMVESAAESHQRYLEKRYGVSPFKAMEDVECEDSQDDGWIKFTANDNPSVPAWLHPEDVVDVKLKCGDIISGDESWEPAEGFDWSAGLGSATIVAYRIVKKWRDAND